MARACSVSSSLATTQGTDRPSFRYDCVPLPRFPGTDPADVADDSSEPSQIGARTHRPVGPAPVRPAGKNPARVWRLFGYRLKSAGMAANAPRMGRRGRLSALPGFPMPAWAIPHASFVETTRPGTVAAKNARARPVSGAQHREPLALVPGQGFRGHSRLHDHSIDLGEGRNHVRRGGIQLFG